MADKPDERSRKSSEDRHLYDYTTSIVSGTEDYSLFGVPVFEGWYDADGNPCTMQKYKTGPDGNPVPIDPKTPPPVHRP